MKIIVLRSVYIFIRVLLYCGQCDDDLCSYVIKG